MQCYFAKTHRAQSEVGSRGKLVSVSFFTMVMAADNTGGVKASKKSNILHF